MSKPRHSVANIDYFVTVSHVIIFFSAKKPPDQTEKSSSEAACLFELSVIHSSIFPETLQRRASLLAWERDLLTSGFLILHHCGVGGFELGAGKTFQPRKKRKDLFIVRNGFCKQRRKRHQRRNFHFVKLCCVVYVNSMETGVSDTESHKLEQQTSITQLNTLFMLLVD